MLTKEQLENVLKEQEILKSKVDEYGNKSKALEEENLRLTNQMKSYSGNRTDSDEQKALRYFGVDHPKKLLGVNIASPEFASVPEHLKYLAIGFKKSVDVARMTAQLFHGAPLDDAKFEEGKVVAVKNILDSYYGKNILSPKLKAFGSTVATGGDEWVPTMISSSYIEEYILERVLETRFKQVNMLSNPYDIPAISSGTKARKATEGVAMTATNPLTTKLSVSSVKLAEYYELPEELNEDSAPDALSMGRDECIKAQKSAVEAALISGDDDGTHIDSDLQALGADIAEKIWKGLRRQSIVNSANGSTYDMGNAIVDDTKLGVLISRMGKFSVNPREVMWIVGPAVWAQMRKLSSVFTEQNFGPQAVVHTGTLGLYFGSEIVVSEFMRENLNATGVYDGVTTNRAAMLCVNKTRWFLGQRRPIQVKLMMDLPYHDRWLIASYRRVGFVGFPQGADEVSVAYGYNIAK
jgi:hypothetical protein